MYRVVVRIPMQWSVTTWCLMVASLAVNRVIESWMLVFIVSTSSNSIVPGYIGGHQYTTDVEMDSS